jgi:hypothetical protein
MHLPPPGSLHPPRPHALTRTSQYPFFRPIQPPHTKSSSSSSQFQNPNFCKTSPSASRQSTTPRRSAPAPTPTKPPARNEEEMCEFASTAMPTKISREMVLGALGQASVFSPLQRLSLPPTLGLGLACSISGHVHFCAWAALEASRVS